MIQIGVDFGGTKIEAAALDRDGAFLARLRAPNPGSYAAALIPVRDLVVQTEREAGGRRTVGVGAPGSVSRRTGVIRNANSTRLNGRPFREDQEGVRLASGGQRQGRGPMSALGALTVGVRSLCCRQLQAQGGFGARHQA